MSAAVYQIEIGDKKQIGSTGRLEARIKEHLKALEQNCHSNSFMQNVYNKYGNFNYRVLSYHNTREEAYIEEQKLLDEYFGKDGYMMQNPKAVAPPVKKGIENPFSQKEVIEKLVQTKRDRGLFVKSQETKNKISTANKGRKQSEEEVAKRTEVLKAIKASKEYKDAQKAGCLKSHKSKSVEMKLNSTRLFRENNPSYKVQTCPYCDKAIQGASAFKRFHGGNCKLKT